jgi:hypothetical protein
MKIRSFLILILVSIALSSSYGQKTRFFIMSRLVGPGDQQRVAGAVSYFITSFDNKLKKTYPCTTVLCENDIGTLLGHERQRQLLGSETPGLMESISDALGCEYLVSLEIGTLPGEKFVVNASLIPYKSKIPMLHASAYSDFTSTSGGQNLKNCEEVAQKLVDGLKEIEICPFKGSVKVRVVSELQKDTTLEYPVYCNGSDGIYKVKKTVDNHADNNWDLKKIEKIRTEGTASFDLHEDSKTEEQNDCYKCSSGRQGARMYNEEKKKYGELQGLSQESQEKGQPIADARVEIRFSKDGQYTIQVDATSQKGDITTINSMHAEGTCGIINDKPEKITQKGDVPLHYTFGPYQGTSQDKILKEKPDPIQETSPISGEKTTYYLEFDLERD